MDRTTIVLQEDIIVRALQKYIDECDGDELARICGDTFGGFCMATGNGEYLFTPQVENYYGEFDSIIERLKKKKVRNG